jgi:hypothetical protein
MKKDLEFVAPRTIRRACGGWLAISAVGSPLQIGVVADTEEDAREAFARAFIRWDEILSSSSRQPSLPVATPTV